MPSLWKLSKSNRVFPTSLVDLFVKNREKLKKPSKKKHRLKQLTTTTTQVHQWPILPQLESDPELDVSSCSIDEKIEEIVANNKNPNLYVKEIVAQKNPYLELNHDFCKDDDKEEGENWGISISKIVVWLPVLKGALIVVVALYTKRFVFGIILGTLLLFLLEYLGNLAFRVFKTYEFVGLLWILKGTFVVVVALYMKKFVVGIIIGAFSLLLLEYVGNSILGFINPCENAKRKLHGNEVLSKREIEQEIGNGDVLKMEIEQGFENGVNLSEIEQENGNVITLKGEIEQVNEHDNILRSSCLVEMEVWKKPVFEIEPFESNFTTWPINNAECSGTGGYCELWWNKGAMEGGESDGEVCIKVKNNGKRKKAKKFLKKFVPKRIHRKKKHKHGKENNQPYLGFEKMPTGFIEDIRAEIEDEDEEQEITDGERSSSSSSSDEEGGSEQFGFAIHSYTGMLQVENMSTKSYTMINKNDVNIKIMTFMVIPLAGLLTSRIFAIILTVACCLLFKMVITLRAKIRVQ